MLFFRKEGGGVVDLKTMWGGMGWGGGIYYEMLIYDHILLNMNIL